MDPRLESEPVRRFTAQEYKKLVAQGWFEGESIELLYGQIVAMTPQGDGHWNLSRVLMHLLARALPIERYGIAAHSPFAATADSMPEPDLLVFDAVTGRRGIPAEALLAVEVAMSSLRRDRLAKLPLYATAGIPEYWIVVAPGREVEIYTQPRNGTYMHMERVDLDGVLRPRFDSSIEIAMSSLPWPDAPAASD
ncbi:Uma2 family endonuclease [soil metagenome]